MRFPSHALTVIGIVIMLAGLLFDTSIETSRGDKVHNLGMMNDRLAIIIFGAAFFIGGILLKSRTPPGEALPTVSAPSVSGLPSRKALIYKATSVICVVIITLHPLRYLLASETAAYIVSIVIFGFLALLKGDDWRVLQRLWLVALIFECIAVYGFMHSFFSTGYYVFNSIALAGESFSVFSLGGTVLIYVAIPFFIALCAYLTLRKISGERKSLHSTPLQDSTTSDIS